MASMEHEYLMQESADVEWLSLAGDLGRDVAPRCLLGPGEGHSELILFAPSVDRVDVVTGTAARLRVARHFREHPRGSVVITPPSSAGVAERFLELLLPLPDGVTVSEPLELEEPSRFALVPATVIADDVAAVAAAAFALEACDRGRISEVRANMVAWSVAELGANALAHARDLSAPPVVAVTVSGRERLLEIAVSDLGSGLSDASDSSRLLRAVPGAHGGLGGLADFIRRGTARRLDVSLEMFAGTGRLRWTQHRHGTSKGLWVPGTTVVARVRA